MEATDLLWLHSGLYRLLFGTSLSTAVVAAEEVLVKVRNQSTASVIRVVPAASRIACLRSTSDAEEVMVPV